LVAFVNFGG
jgi:hypothetical protein